VHKKVAIAVIALGGLASAAPPSDAPARDAKPAHDAKPRDTKPAKPSEAKADGKQPAATAARPGEASENARTPAPTKEATYDAALAGALPAEDLPTLLEPLFAECRETGDLARRQCETIRAFHIDRLRGNKWHAVADASAAS
jgi:hypothetical protein